MFVLPVLIPLVIAGVAHADPREDAVLALAEGRQARAIQLLADGVAVGGDGAPELRCLLGRVQHQAGRHADALETLGFVSDEAPCAMGAAWVRAEAMLALGMEEQAGAIYARLGEEALGPDRDARTVQRLVGLADRVLERDEPGLDQAVEALSLALRLTVDEQTELELARRLVDLATELGTPQRARQAMPVLARAVDRDSEASDRRRLASLVGGSAGLAVLEGLPMDLETGLLRLDLGSGLSLPWRLERLEALVVAFPQAPETRRAQLRVGRELAAAGWLVESAEVLEPLSAGQDELAAEASERLARLALDAGDDNLALERLHSLLERFPHAEQRAWAEQRLAETLWREGQRAAAAGAYPEALALFELQAGQDSARAAYAVGVVLRSMGEIDEARRRWSEIPARWPGSDASRAAMLALYRLQALDADDPDGALAWLEERAASGLVDASWLLNEIEQPLLAVDSDGSSRVGGRPAVRVLTRGHEELEARLHRVDLEAWLRAGQSLDQLAQLDLGIIEPDRSWPLDVPDAHPARVSNLELPVPVPGPGLYAVTVASTEREARTLLLHSEARVVAQRAGPLLAVAVFTEGRPVAGARVLVREDSEVRELRTDSTGLAQAEHRGGSLLVLASSAYGPALLELDPVEDQRPGGAVLSSVDLDRAVYRPGDRLGFRIAVDRVVAPERRDWTLWLDGGGGFAGLARQRFEERGDGTVVGELPLPLGSTGHDGIAAGTHSVTLMAQRPDGEQITLATVRIVDVLPEGRSLDLHAEDRTARVTLLEEDGSPAVGVPVDWTWTQAGLGGRVVTDTQGQASLEGPAAGVPWTVTASVPGTGLYATAWRGSEEAVSWSLRGSGDRLRSTEALELTATGEGASSLLVQRLLLAENPPPLADPWGLEPRWTGGLEGPESWSGLQPLTLAGSAQTVHHQILDLDRQARLSLPALPPGRYRVELLSASGEGRATSLGFEVHDEAPRLSLPASLGAGQRLVLGLDGQPALVVLRSNDDAMAAVLPAGGIHRLTVPASWRDDLSVVASAPSGATHHRSVALEPALETTLTVEEGSEGWRLHAVVTDAAGTPVRAQVVLRAVDLKLERQVGSPIGLVPGPQREGVWWSRAGAWSGSLRFGAYATAVSAALLAERAREEEARRARRALSGALMDNAVQAALGEDVPLSAGMGGLGSYGSGLGGGGSAYGMGGLGTKGRGYGAGGAPPRPLQGVRERLLWAVLETDEAGVVELTMPTPPRVGRYRVEAVALADGWVARDEAIHTSPGGPRVTPAAQPEPSLAAMALADDPHLGHEPGRAALAARAALALAAQLEGPEREAAMDRVRSLLGAVSRSPGAYRSVGEAAQALALLGELGDLWTLPRGTAQAFDVAIDVEGASRADRVALVWARARAGLPVDDASIARLLREPEQLWPEEAAQLARALILLDRRTEARPLVAGGGSHALLASRALARRRAEHRRLDDGARALLAAPPPRLGNPGRPAWIAAVESIAEDQVLLPEAPAQALPLEGCAQRLPLSADGLPVRVHTSAAPGGDPPCRPGRIALTVGDALRVEGSLRRASFPQGLERIPDPLGSGFLLRAVAPGVHRVENIERKTGAVAMVVEVDQGEAEPLAQGVALALAQQAWAAGADPSLWLDTRPGLDGWHPRLRGDVARLRFQQAVQDGSTDAVLVAAFEDLRDVDPRGSVTFPEILATARAYRMTRPLRAMDIQRTAIGAAFLDEAAIASRLERVLGPLAAIQVLWEIAGRYPAVPVVEQALYELPDRVLDMGAGGHLPPELRQVGVTPTDLRLMSAAWNREFVVLHPDAPLAPLAGRRLVVDLLHLGAWERAAGWASRLAAEHPQHELCDSFLYLEGLAGSAAGDHRQAAALLRRVNKQRFVQPDGLEGPSELRSEAELALARLLEARGDRAGAEAAYAEAAHDLDEAQASLLQLRHRSMALDDLLLLEPGEPAVLPVTVAGVDRVFLRAYRLDLRTLFLRDSGLQGVEHVQVAGISPAWSGERMVKERPYPKEHDLRLPLGAPGAWLVQLHAGDQARTALVVRSELELSVADAGGLRRVTVLRRGRPAAGVQVRALAGGEVVAAVTDQRGVAIVPAYAPTLAFDGPHYAFTQAHQAGASTLSFEGGDELLRRVDQRLERQREVQRSSYEHIGRQGGSGLEASAL
jgi:tetratricopeptide (TPR) repeat protein